MFLSASIPGVLLLLGGLFLPYSPRWLFAKGKTEKAKKSFAKTHHSSWVGKEWDNFVALINYDKQTFGSFFKAIGQAKYLKPMLMF